MKKKKPRQLYYKLFWSYIMIAFFIVLSLIVYFISRWSEIPYGIDRKPLRGSVRRRRIM